MHLRANKLECLKKKMYKPLVNSVSSFFILKDRQFNYVENIAHVKAGFYSNSQVARLTIYLCKFSLKCYMH